MRLLVIQNNKHKSIYTRCIYTLLEDICRKQDYQIHFAENFNAMYDPAANTITFVTIASTSFISKLIAQQRLSSFIKKNNIGLLVQNTGFFFKQKKIPQLLIADNIEKLPAVKKISYSKIFLLTYSQFAKQAIIEKGFTNIVHVVPFAASDLFQPITWSNKQQVKIDFTEGTEYFFTPDDFTGMEEILKLLKAFSAFKKWQQSSMKLVIAGKLYVPPGDWQKKLDTYKYREDVLIYNKLPEDKKALLLAGAYACIHLPKNGNDLLPLLQSVQCHTPVITFETPGIKEYADGAMRTATAGDYDALTQQMILLYKDESMRDKLVASCAVYADELAKVKTMQALQSIIS